LIHSLDDPFLPADAVPHLEVAENPHLDALFTAAGGHVGFVTGPPWAPRCWAESTAADFLAERL
jgi:predicted alpha/beta-fold hydrolase